ncbi:hypothetical protein JQX08_17460 [Pseudomonas sp. UL073]|uniref:NarX-like N-terminal domain-containing protein n=1 Tax=Zestomonas insulae TaxID=2809017 RepID=A0ABS2IJJ1_9GAMM|nr:hypothetical protein [Pseudomonas insulae]MBM7062504.1 hypothetical protein [Pseudomonas insulae]
MRNSAVLRRLCTWSLALLATLASLAMAQPASPLEQMQVYACRATSSLLLFRGEGFQSDHAERMNNDLAALDGVFKNTPQITDDMRKTHDVLVAELRRGAAFGHKEEDMPWSYPRDLSKALRDFLAAVNKQEPGNATELVPVQVEYLAVQYLFRAYIGTFEVAKEDTELYLGQDERKLVPSIDGELSQLSVPDMEKIKTRWQYLRVALNDLNSGTTAMESISGRPFAPTMVDRHARSLTTQLMAIN